MTRNVFIATKPLQICICKCVITSLDIEDDSEIYLIPHFENYTEHTKVHSDSPVYVKPNNIFSSKHELISKIDLSTVDNIYFDSDIGLKNYIYLARLKVRKPKVKLHIFEEGVGTYKTKLRTGLKKYIGQVFGIGSHMGGAIFIENAYVFRPKYYNRLFNTSKGKKITFSLQEFIDSNFAELNDFYQKYLEINPTSKDACVYLPNWWINCDDLKILKSNNEDKYIKLHPHFQRYKGADSVNIVPGLVLGEFFIKLLLQKYQRVTVYHRNSSVFLYINSRKLVLIDLQK